MFSSPMFRSFGAALALAATVALSACGGGGSGGSSGGSSVLKLSSALQSEHVARYAGAFGMLSGPGVAAIYTSVVQSLVTNVTNVTAGAANTTTACPASGSISVVTQGAGQTGLQTGETATVGFNQCVGQVKAPGVSSSASITGTVSVQIQNVQGIVGNASNNWSYSAIETANALTLVSTNGKTVVNGTVNYTMSYDTATGITTTTASSPTVTLDRTQTAGSGSISGQITITSLMYSRLHGADPVTDTLATSGNISVNAADATIAFAVSTPTPVTINGGKVQGGVIKLSTSDTVESISPKDESAVIITVTSNGKTATYTETIDDFRSLAGA